jgi:hypothetical protein
LALPSTNDLPRELERLANEAVMQDRYEWALTMREAAAELRRLRAALGPREVT